MGAFLHKGSHGAVEEFSENPSLNPKTLSPQPQNPSPETLNPNPFISPKTLNPKPCALKPAVFTTLTTTGYLPEIWPWHWEELPRRQRESEKESARARREREREVSRVLRGLRVLGIRVQGIRFQGCTEMLGHFSFGGADNFPTKYRTGISTIPGEVHMFLALF